VGWPIARSSSVIKKKSVLKLTDHSVEAAVNLGTVFIKLSEEKLDSKEKINNLFIMTKPDPYIEH
jgi:methyl coenzyme M reductase subunit D